MTTLVSACLLGFPCRHDGQDKRDERVLSALEGKEIVPVCPEVAAGFGVPRPAAMQDLERGLVVDALGSDITDRFAQGALVALSAARAHGATRAILKQNSPSCGTRLTGTTKGRAPGQGVTAKALRAAGLLVLGEDELA